MCKSVLDNNYIITNRKNECQEFSGRCLSESGDYKYYCNGDVCNQYNCREDGGNWKSIKCRYEEGKQCIWTDANSSSRRRRSSSNTDNHLGHRLSSDLYKTLKNKWRSKYWIYDLNNIEKNKLNGTVNYQK